MKNKIFISCFLFINMTLAIRGQDFHITVDNPSPRQYQNIEVKIEVTFFDDYLRKQLGKDFEIYPGLAFPFSKSMSPLDTGEFQIGPFEFILNNKRYKSDSIKIKVVPPLPEKEGLYLSSRIIDEKTIIIIEQVYKFKTKPGLSYGSGSSELVDIVINDYNRMLANTKESSDSPLRMGKSLINNSNLHYSIKSYEITNYTGKPIKLTKEDFKNLPIDYMLPDIIIK